MCALAACDSGPKHVPISQAYAIDRDRPAPKLDGTKLTVHVAYGGCNDSQFELRHRIQDGTAQLWLRRVDHNNFSCDMAISHSATLDVPAEALQQRAIVLLSPGPRRDVLR